MAQGKFRPRLSVCNCTATAEIYTLSLHDALPISACCVDHDAGTARPRGVSRQDHPHRCPLPRSEEHTSELQSPDHLVCRLLLEKKNVMSRSQRAEISATHQPRL